MRMSGDSPDKMEPTRVEIISDAGVAVPVLATTSIRWQLSAGTDPVIEDFNVKIEDLAALQGFGRGPGAHAPIQPVAVREEGGGTTVRSRPGAGGGGPPGTIAGQVGANALMRPVKLRIRSSRFERAFAPGLGEMGGAGGAGVKTIEFTNLFMVDFPPGPNEFIGTVRLADRRFWWKYGWSLRRFNMTMRTGTKRVFDDGNDLRPALDHFGYKVFSTEGAPGGGLWKGVDIIKLAYQDCALPEFEARAMGAIPEMRVDPNARRSFPDTLDIISDNIELDDRADQAMARAVAQCPGMNVFLDKDGEVVLFHEHDLSENQQVPPAVNAEGAAMHEIENAGHLALVDNRWTRPTSVRVNFTYEAEVKFRFHEEYRGSTSSSSARGTVPRGGMGQAVREDELEVDNVMPLSDHELTITDTNRAGAPQAVRTVATGTWVEINNDLFTAWGAVPRGIGQLDWDMVLRGAIPFLDLWGVVGLAGMANPDVDWMGRIASVAGHWRRTFRIPELFVQRIVDLKPWRAGMLDPVTGARAKASVYADYSIVPNQRVHMALAERVGGAWDGSFIMQVKNKWAEAVRNNKAQGIPAMIGIVDAEQGVFHVDFLPDAGRMFAQFIPGTIQDNRAPTDDILHGGNPVRPISWDAARRGFVDMPKIQGGWESTFIMTCIPGAPNNLGQCYVEEVSFDDIKDQLPAAAQGGGGLAPPLEVHVPMQVATARLAWNDRFEDDIKKLFGIGNPVNQADDVFDVLIDRASHSRRLEHLLVNRGRIAGGVRRDTIGEDLLFVAQAYAVSAYMEYIDRIEGTASTDLQRPNARGVGVGPTGHLTSVSFEVAPDGKATTSFSLPEKISPLPFFSFLDPGTRAVVLGLALVGLNK